MGDGRDAAGRDAAGRVPGGADGGPFIPLPSATSRYLEVEYAAGAFPRTRGAYHHQRFSARAGVENAIHVSGFRMYLPNENVVALVNGTSCLGGVGSAASMVVADLVAGAGTESTFTFTGAIPEDLIGEFTVCMCEDKQWELSASMKYPADLTLSADIEKELCTVKCGSGCEGSGGSPYGCFCDGMLPTDEEEFGDSHAGPLCLDAESCRAACAAQAGCLGYSVDKTLNRCVLSGGMAVANDDFDSWMDSGMVCNGTGINTDFVVESDDPTTADLEEEAKRNLGVITITQKVDLEVDYVVTPNLPMGESTSFEVTGTGLDPYADRVMVIDCTGMCGVTPPSESVSGLAAPVNTIVDRPSLHEHAGPDPTPEAYSYNYDLTEMYCAGNLLPLAEGSLAAGHQCYKKCFAETCTGDSCFCDGFIAGYDTETSSSLCLDQDQCENLCSLTVGCHSVDMHRTLNRCYFNSLQCEAHIVNDMLTPDPNYDILVKVLDTNRGRLLSGHQARRLVAAQDPGNSWGEILRFEGVTFAQGGEFKLCFCDSSLLGPNEICGQPEHFSVEVGTVHATGLQCLLSKPEMTRGTCVPQLYGGLRCYEGPGKTVDVPEDYLAVPPQAGRSPVAASLITFCQFSPEARANPTLYPFCAQYRLAAGAGMSLPATP
jgi:hypothetical protein